MFLKRIADSVGPLENLRWFRFRRKEQFTLIPRERLILDLTQLTLDDDEKYNYFLTDKDGVRMLMINWKLDDPTP